MKNYTIKDCEKLIDKYVNEFKGDILEIKEGCLGLGTILLYGANGKKAILITEIFATSWTSSHTIRMYNKLPKKYNNLIDNQ